MAIKKISKKREMRSGKIRKYKYLLPMVRRHSTEIQILTMNKRLARLRSSNDELIMKVETLKKTNRLLSDDRSDVVQYLKRMADDRDVAKIELYHSEQLGIKDGKSTDTLDYERKLDTAREDYNLMQERLTSEIKLLRAQLNSANELRQLRESSSVKFDIPEDIQMKDHETTQHYKRIISDLERKIMQDKEDMKREMERRFTQLADDFHDAANMCMHSVMHRTIRENIAVHNELEKVLEQNRSMKTKYTEFDQASQRYDIDLKIYEEEKCQLLHKASVQRALIDKLTEKCEAASKHLLKYKEDEKNFAVVQEELRKSMMREQHLTVKMKTIEQKMHTKDCETASMRQELTEEKSHNVKYINALRKANTILKKLHKLQGHDGDAIRCSAKRQEHLDYLSHLFEYASNATAERISSSNSEASQGDMYRNAADQDSDQSANQQTWNQFGNQNFVEFATERIEPIVNVVSQIQIIAQPQEAVQKLEEEIIEEIIEQDEVETCVSTVCSQDFSKPMNLESEGSIISEGMDVSPIEKEDRPLPYDLNNKYELEMDEVLKRHMRIEDPFLSKTRDLAEIKISDSLHGSMCEFLQATTQNAEDDTRHKRASTREDKKLTKRSRRSLLPRIEQNQRSGSTSTMALARPSRKSIDERKSSSRAGFARSSDTWSNMSARRISVDTFSFRSQSRDFQSHSSMTSNTLRYHASSHDDKVPEAVLRSSILDQAKERDSRITNNKRLQNSNVETPVNSVLTHKSMYDDNFDIDDTSADMYYY